MYNQGNFSSSSHFRPNNPQQSSMQPPPPPSHQGGGGAPPQPPPPPPPLQPPQFPSAPAPLAVQHGGPMYYHGPPPPPRLAPIPSPHGQMLYSTAAQFHPPPPPQYGQFLPPPPPLPSSGFVPVSSSYVHSSYENPFETVSLPPPSLPPPQPPLPRDSTSNVLASSSVSSDGRNAEDGNRCVKGETGKDSEVNGFLPAPPRKPAEQEIVHKIELLCRYIAKNGPAFEEKARENGSGNPEYAFLFGGEPGSEAAIAHDYFQWMKSKCCMNLQLDKLPEKIISLPAPLEIEDASHSAQDSDMEMEDDMNQFDKDQGVSDSVEGLKEHVFKSNEVSFVKEQSPEHPHLIFSPSVNTTSGLLPGSKASVVAADKKEQHECVLERPSTEDDSSASGGLRYTYQKRKRVVPLTGLASVPHADGCVSGEEASGALIKIQSPLFRRFQEYASDDSAEDNNGMPYEDMSPVMVSPSVTASKTSSHEDEMTILYADVGCENISAKEEVIMPSAKSGSIHPIDPRSRKPNTSQDSLEVIEASEMANDSLDTTVKLQDNYSGDQTSCSLTFKDDIQGDAGIGGHSDRLRKRSTEKRLTSKKVDQFGRLVREDASESDSDGARYTRRRARRGRSRSRSRSRSRNRSRSKSRSRSRSRSRSPHSRRRRKSRSPRRRKDRRNRSRSWTPKRQRSRSRSPNFRHKGENVREKRQDNRGQIPDCMDFLRGRCFRGVSCKYLHHTLTSGDPVKDNKSRYHEYLEPPQGPKNSDINGVSQIVMNTNVGNTNPLSQVSVEHGTSLKEEFKNQEMLPYSSVDIRKDCRLSVNKNSGSVMDDGRRVTLSGSVQSAAGVNLSDSEAAITGVIVEQAPQEELGVQLKENEICRQPLETLPSEVLPVQLKVVSEAQHLTGVVSQNEPSSLPNNVQPPQTNIPSSQSSLVDVSVLSTQLISQPFCGHPSNPYPIPTSMSQTQVHQVTATSSFPLQNVAPQPTDSIEFHNFPPSGFHSYASSLPRPPAFPQDVNAAYMSMPPTANIHGQLAPMERLPLYQAPFQDQHSQYPVPPQQTWAPLPPASNSAFQNPAFHLQFLQQPMQPGNEFFRPVMRPYSHEVPYNNMSQLSVAGTSKLHHNPYASTFEQTPGNSRFSSVLRQDMEPNYRSNNDSLGSNASISGQGIGAFDSKLTDLPLDSSRSGGQVLGNENLPLFESVESSSTTLGKLGNTGRQAVEGASAANMSPGDGEFGDTAIDAEVGAVVNGSPHLAEEGNWSPENPADAGNTASGDDEIGQAETSGKSKKSKDSRSMKHFRAALADFVKEVLKPSWRQGNMSKEAFKTIVKKTVDKVSGAMKKHQIPKSQAKINQYVESSQRKLTKLVMGYVDKYVKV